MKQYLINKDSYVPYKNQVDYCIGTGRMGLALQKEYMEQLTLIQEEIGFSHIRGHGLFSDDMAIYHEYEDEEGKICAEYNFTYLDFVMDNYRKVGLKPFIELGFMPDKLASGKQTIFYWKGNTTPPKDHGLWCDMVLATLSHLMERYGADEVVTWPIEVWNEPNLPGFWEHADMEKYFYLFEVTILAIKKLDDRFRVGGPAICGVDDKRWMKCFLEYCQKKQLPIDFITRHHYTTEFPEQVGHYNYAKLTEATVGFENLQGTREIVDSFEEYKGFEIHLTEFNTSYVPDCPLHDINRNAAFLAEQLSRLGEEHASYSYWTFGDVFEEKGVPFAPFHGGFGLLANGCIHKPTYWSFYFYKQCKEGICVLKNEDFYVVKMPDGSYRGVTWHKTMEGENTGKVKELLLNFSEDVFGKTENHYEKTEHILGETESVFRKTKYVQEKKQYSFITQTVDEETCNPFKLWHDLGEPISLSDSQLELLKKADKPLVQSQLLQDINGVLQVPFTVKENGVIYFEITPVTIKSDRGFDYTRAIQSI